MLPYVQYETITCILNFGYWVKRSSGSPKLLQKLVEMIGDSEYLHEEDILYYQASQVTFLPKNRNMTVSLDGEPVGILPAVFKLYHNALTMNYEARHQ
jgi:diacylglycerol kinase family enzyme